MGAKLASLRSFGVALRKRTDRGVALREAGRPNDWGVQLPRCWLSEYNSKRARVLRCALHDGLCSA